MIVHYNNFYSNTLIVSGGFSLGISLCNLLVFDEVDIDFLLPGLLILGLGIFFFRGEYFEVSQTALTLKAPLGSRHKNYSFESPRSLSLEGKNVYLNQGAERKKLPISYAMANRRDWESFSQWLGRETSSS